MRPQAGYGGTLSELCLGAGFYAASKLCILPMRAGILFAGAHAQERTKVEGIGQDEREAHLCGRLPLHRGAYEGCPVRPVPGSFPAQPPSCYLSSDWNIRGLRTRLFHLLSTCSSVLNIRITLPTIYQIPSLVPR